MSMEKKLAAYRAEQGRSEKLEKYQNKVKTIFTSFLSKKTKQSPDVHTEKNQKNQNNPPESSSTCLKKRTMKHTEETQELISDDVVSINSDDSLTDDSLSCCTWFQLLYYLLYFILWATIYMIFIELQFGTVYLISSALIFMYINTRTEPKKTGEVSAYSVFNKDCASIDGTLKAEQLERQLIYGQIL